MIIYKHTCIITNKSYIGQTRFTAEKRWYHHRKEASYGYKNKFCQAIREFNDESLWTHEILEEFSDFKLLNEREQYWIAYYDTLNSGYNSTSGGKGNMVCSEHVRKKMSLAKLGKKNPHSEEWKIKAKLTCLTRPPRKKHSLETREKMRKTHLNIWKNRKQQNG